MSTQNDQQYFNLTLTGVGFINRFRLNTPAQGNPYYSISIAALRGKADASGKTAKTYIDCNIVGDAVEMAAQMAPYFDSEESPTVLVKFVSGDLELRSFQYKSGIRQGEIGYTNKARLFDIKWFKVNGETFYSEAERLRHAEQENKDNDAAPASTDNIDDADEDVTQTQPQDSSTDTAELPAEVKLVKEDPYFDERKTQLKSQGYRWNPTKELWCLPEVA